MTNSQEIAALLQTKCDGSHSHLHLMECRARAAAIYPEALCRAICQGLLNQKALNRLPIRGLSTEDRHHEQPEKDAELEEEDWQAFDDVTGAPLDPKLVATALRPELAAALRLRMAARRASATRPERATSKLVKVRVARVDVCAACAVVCLQDYL